MNWSKEWPIENPKDLARYVVPEWSRQAANLQFSFNHHDALNTPDGRRKIVASIYNMLRERSPGIHYAHEEYSPEERIQIIRQPEEILLPPMPRGTCLDLSLLFCGLCLASSLLPTLIILQGHALVAVSMNFVLRNDGPTSWKAFNRERMHIENSLGMLKHEKDEDIKFLQQLIASGDLMPVECTGFAHSETLNVSMPEGRERADGFLSFGNAVQAGKEQLKSDQRPFQYALDICYLQYKSNIKPYEKMEILTGKLALEIVGNILVPFLKHGAEKFADVIGGKEGKESASLASKVWEKVQSSFGSGKDKERIETFKKMPEEKESLITPILVEKLEEDNKLAQELYELINTTKTDDGKNVVKIIAEKVGYIDARGSQIGGNSIVAGYIGSQNTSRPDLPTTAPGKE
jgi:hypothetical protein